MVVFKAKSKQGVIYNDHFPAEPPRKRLPGFIRAGGLELANFSQKDAAALRKINPELFNKLFTVRTVVEKKKNLKEPTE